MRTFFILPAMVALLLSGFGSTAWALTAVVSIPPQQFVLEQLAAERVQVLLLQAPGKSPVDASVSLSKLHQLRDADVIFTIGVGLEKAWLPQLKRFATKAKVVDMAERTERFPMPVLLPEGAEAQGHNHSHDHEGHSHAPSSLDPHVWLSTDGMQAMADTALETLNQLDPEGVAQYTEAHQRFSARLKQLREQLTERFLARAKRPVLMYHPSWYYFAREFGFEIIPIEQEGKEPSLAALQQTIDLARQAGVRHIFAQSEFSSRATEIVADKLGAQTVVLKPLSKDWFASMQEASLAFSEALYD